jgi:urease accessory protein
MRLQKLLPVTAAVLSVLAAAPASAHHVMGGKTPATFFEGLLSGIGHPIIGPDHLAFLIAVGIIVGAAGLSLTLVVLYVIAMALGVALHVSGMNVPAAELAVGLSVVLAGGLMLVARPLPAFAWALLFVIAGLFHGYAFGESIVGAERAPLGAYLLGLIVIQSALTLGVALLARQLNVRVGTSEARIAGVAIVVLGIAALTGFLPGA